MTSNRDRTPPEGQTPPGSATAAAASSPPTQTNHQTAAQQTKPMEVHHHPHVEKKGFKEYLLEGVMIFVAVTLGFFAESLREHVTNRETAQVNMESLVRNLEEDSLQLSRTIQFNELKSRWIDSFVAIKRSRQPDTSIQKQFICYAIKLSAVQSFISNQTAFEEMKSSGTLRLLRPEGVVDSILRYESIYEPLSREAFGGSGLPGLLSDEKGQLAKRRQNDQKSLLRQCHAELWLDSGYHPTTYMDAGQDRPCIICKFLKSKIS